MPRADETDIVHIVDDDEAIRDSLAFLLETAGFSTRGHGSAVDFLATLPGHEPGCVITDIRMPGIDGLELQQRLIALGANLPVIVITGHGDVPMAVRAIQGGALDFLEKPFDDEKLLDAVRRALAASRNLRAENAAAQLVAIRLSRLTAREQEVFHALVAGLANKEIARNLGVSPRTVEVHRARVMEKMAANGLPDLIHQALAAGLVTGQSRTGTC